MQKAVLIISTLDTKGEETLYLRDKIASLGMKPLLMDISMRGKGPSPAEITPPGWRRRVAVLLKRFMLP